MLRLVRSLVDFTSTRDRRRSADGFFLSADRFELAAVAERMRVDRNGSIVSLLILEPSRSKNAPRDIQSLEQRMAGRLRLTDTAGWLRDGRLGLLLPDTPEAGAWKVAADLCQAYGEADDRPRCEVVVYPERDQLSRDEPTDEAPPGGSGERAEREWEEIPTAPAGAGAGILRCDTHVDSLDSLLAKPLPLWKRALDITGSLIGLAVAGPLIVVAAMAVKLTSPGGAFFVQEREGLGGKRFRMYKLRSMRQDAEQMQDLLRDSNEQDGPAFKIAHDPRVTAVGRVLRSTSLDELPQLWNVLRGDMSLVGPRPLPVRESLACEPWQRRRLFVTPGLTCTWQIYGRNVVPFDDWIRMDLDYAERRNPLLDLKLVAQTGPTLVLRKGR